MLFISLLYPALSAAQDSTGMVDPIYYGPYEEVEGNFYVRVYLIYVDAATSNWTVGLDLSARTGQIIDNLNNAYNPHGIYFIQYSLESYCNGTYINEQDFSKKTSENIGDQKTDALTIWDYGATSNNPSSGWAFSIPSKKMQLFGINAGLDEVVIHEAGHCLGLIHTHGFLGGGADMPINCNSSLDGQNCYSYCDLTCDVPFNDAYGGINAPNCINSNYDIEIIRNYMSYVTPGDCRDEFSLEQVKRMRYHLKNHVHIEPMVIATTLPGDPIPTDISGDIIIESGTHTIYNPIQMLPGAKIVVKQGARLNIYAPITAACVGMWEGIIVEGIPNGAAVQNGLPPGRVSLYSSGVIEHAKCGIQLGTYDANGQQTTGGGVLSPCNGGFINCSISIKFEPAPANGFAASQISGAQFYLDNSYRGGSGQPIFIDANKIATLRVKGSWFKDHRTSLCAGPASRALGIFAKGTSIVATSNQFYYLAKAVIVDQQINGAFQAIGNGFNNCFLGIESNKNSNFAIRDNDFQIVAPPGCSGESVGVSLSGNAAGFSFTKNTFTGLDNGAVGTVVKATGTANKVIFDNDYSNLFVGNRAEGDNGNEDAGLTYACNSHTTSKDDYIVIGSADIRRQQQYVDNFGNPAATGNTFTGIINQGSFNNSSADIQYFFAGASNNTNPQHFSYGNASFSGVVGVQMSKNNAVCISVNPCPPPCDESVNELFKQSFFANRQERNERKANLANLTNPLLIAAEKDSIRNLEWLMEQSASLIVQNYALDTTNIEIKIDSILTWLKLSGTYSTDLELIKNYFFSGNFSAFDVLWSQIPNKYVLNGDDLNEFNELGFVYELIRPALEDERSLFQLPQITLDSLKFWKTWCSEPGYLAKSILRWNGIETEQNCLYPQRTTERSQGVIEKPKVINGDDFLKIFPNPATQTLNIEFQYETDNVAISFYDIHGKLFKLEQLHVQGRHVNLSVAELVDGLYFVKVQLNEHKPIFSKIRILH